MAGCIAKPLKKFRPEQPERLQERKVVKNEAGNYWCNYAVAGDLGPGVLLVVCRGNYPRFGCSGAGHRRSGGYSHCHKKSVQRRSIGRERKMITRCSSRAVSGSGSSRAESLLLMAWSGGCPIYRVSTEGCRRQDNQNVNGLQGGGKNGRESER